MQEDLKLLVALTDAVMNENEPPEKGPVDEKAFFRLARENGLSGMVYPLLAKDDFSQAVYEAFKKDHLAYHAADIRQQKHVMELQGLLNKAGIDHVFLKGTYLKTLYPKPYMRAMGDIDLLVRKETIEDVRILLQEHGYRLESKSAQHDFYIKEQEFVEVHPTLYKAFSKRYENILQNPWEEAEAVIEHTHRFRPEFHLLYLLFHLVKHFHSSGVGLRSILDIGVFMRHHEIDLDKKRFENFLQEGNLTRFFQNMLYLNRMLFGIETSEQFLADYTMSEELFAKTVTFIATSGIHGQGEGFNRFLTKQIRSTKDQRLQKQNKLRVLLSILFPAKASMKTMYPVLEKHPYLLPFTYVARVFRLAIRKRKRSFAKFKELRNVESHSVEEAKALYEELGL